MTLEQIGQRIRELTASTRDQQIEVARLVVQAKQMFRRDAEWIEWAAQAVNIKRRSVYRYQAVVRFLEDLSERPQSTLATMADAMPYSHLAMLAALAIEQADELAARHDLAELSREELQDAINALVGKSATATPPYRLESYKLPEPEQLCLALKDPVELERINPRKEWDYASAFISRSGSAYINRRDFHSLEKMAGEMHSAWQWLTNKIKEAQHAGRK